MTKSRGALERAVMISSVIPSLKYSCCGSSLMFTKGRTAIEGRSGSGKAIFSFDATSSLGDGRGASLVTFSGNGGVPFSLSAGSTEGAGAVGTDVEGLFDGVSEI